MDLIDRQAAIDICNYAADLWHGQLGEGIVIAVRKRIEQLPTVQSEIIHCKECLHKIKNGNNYECNYWDFEDPKDYGFCSFAERKTDE